MRLFGWELRRADEPQRIVQDTSRSPNVINLQDTATDWMGPQNGLAAMAPFGAAGGRRFDYRVGRNTNIGPRTEEDWACTAAGYEQLRFLADSCEIIRMLINRRKDEMTSLSWRFRRRESRTSDASDPGVQKLEEFFARPDGSTDFDAWMQMIVEDMCVLDAPALHISRRTDTAHWGEVAAIENVDGATIKCQVDEYGRTPAAPLGAYLQLLKGVSAVYYSTWDLIFAPHNRRPFSMYGYSPVDTIRDYANLMIRRAYLQLGYYTEGNMPECIIPLKGSADQVQRFQQTFDAQTMGGQKSGKAIFVPAENVDKVLMTKTDIVMTNFDEMLFRIACAAFSESSQPFTSQVNRATAQTAQETAENYGLRVCAKSMQELINRRIIQDPMVLGMPDYEIYVAPEPMTDMAKAAQIAIPAVTAGIMRVDEARDMLGLSGDAPEQFDASPAEASPEDSAPKELPSMTPPPTPEQAAQRVHRMMTRADHVARRRADASLARHMRYHAPLTAALDKWFRAMAHKVAASASTMTRDDDALDAITDSDLTDFESIMSDYLGKIYPDAGDSVLAQIAPVAVHAELKPVVSGHAVEAAKKRAAWLVGRTVTASGRVVNARRPSYRITDEMRRSVHDLTVESVEENWTTDKLEEALSESAGFGHSRALTIARTEIVNAHDAGRMIGARDLQNETGEGIMKRVVLASNENHCEECAENAEAGWIGIDEQFPNGDEHGVCHPNDMCELIFRAQSAVEGDAGDENDWEEGE